MKLHETHPSLVHYPLSFFPLSCVTGEGIGMWISWLKERLPTKVGARMATGKEPAWRP